MQVIAMASELFAKALRGTYPVEIDTLGALLMFGSPRQFSSANEIVSFLDPMISELEVKLTACENNQDLTT